jgi:lysozyme
MTICLDKLTQDLIRDEGIKSKPYKDTQGHLTVGVGHNLDAEGLCLAAISAQLDYDIHTKALAPLDTNCPWWRNLPEPAQRVLANLCFNMGWGTLSQFTRMLTALEQRDFKSAAAQLRASLYARQVGQRAERLAMALEMC